MSDAMPAKYDPPTFKVISQQPRQVVDATGNYVPGVRVTAALANGTTFNVDIPQSGYTLDNVKAVLDAEASKAHAINQLGS